MPRCLFLALLSVIASVGYATEPPTADRMAQPLNIEDLFRMKRLSDAALAPDGQRIAYGVQTWDAQENKEHNSLWLIESGAHGKPAQHLAEEVVPHSAAWSADGRFVYFLSPRDGSQQVWRVSSSGGDPVQVTRFALPVSNFRPSPKLDRLFFVMDVFIFCLDLDCTVHELNKAGNTSLYPHLPARRTDHWDDGRRSQLFSVRLDKQGRAEGSPVRLSITVEGDVLGKPLADLDSYTISPDGKSVIYSERIGGNQEAWFGRTDLYQAAADGGTRRPDGRPEKDAIPRLLTPENRALCLTPVISPDGSQVAFLATDRSNYSADRRHLEIITLATGERRRVSPTSDESIDRFVWSADGKSLLATGDRSGQHPLWRIDLHGGQSVRLTQSGSVEWFAAGSKQLFYALSTLSSPAELSLMSLDGRRSEPLTSLNRELLGARALAQVEPFEFSGSNGDLVHAYFLKPPRVAPDVKTPLTVLLHDGPHESFGNRWDWNANAQLMAAAGLALMLVDYHGSTGYGQAFTDSINGDGGGTAFEDLTNSVDAALKRYPWLNAERICALGIGYGAYLVNWMEGQSPSRFRCFVSHAGIFDSRNAYYTADDLGRTEALRAGPEYDKAGAYEKYNPLRQVANWQTPILFIHGERDAQVPYTESLAAFTAAQRRAVFSSLLIFHDEGHLIASLEDQLRWYQTSLGWLHSISGISVPPVSKPQRSR